MMRVKVRPFKMLRALFRNADMIAELVYLWPQVVARLREVSKEDELLDTFVIAVEELSEDLSGAIRFR